jgi:hypothetical protein
MTHKNAFLSNIHKCSIYVKPFKVVPGHTMKANRVEVQLHSFLTMALDGWNGQPHALVALPPAKDLHITH